MVAEDSILPAPQLYKKSSSRPVVRLLGWMGLHEKIQRPLDQSVINFLFPFENDYSAAKSTLFQSLINYTDHKKPFMSNYYKRSRLMK